MTNITPVRKNIEIEETRFRAAVSESTAQKMGGTMNFINTYQHSEKQWFINGKYWLVSPFDGIDGLTLANSNIEIINVFMFVHQAGLSGDTSLDIKYATSPGGSFTSIFSTPPSINFAAGDWAWCYIGTSFPNTTAPVLSTSTLNVGSVMRADIISTQGSDARGCGIIAHYKPI